MLELPVMRENQVVQQLELLDAAWWLRRRMPGAIEHQGAEHDVTDRPACGCHPEVPLPAIRFQLPHVVQQGRCYQKLAIGAGIRFSQCA